MQADLSELIKEIPCLFDTPIQIHLIEHDIDFGDAQPIGKRLYPVTPEKCRRLVHARQWNC